MDEEGEMVEGSWIEDTAEVLKVTEWEKALGEPIRDSIIDKLNEIEG